MPALRVSELPQSASARPAMEFRPAAPVRVLAHDTPLSSAGSHPAFTYYPRLARIVQYVAARVGDPLSLAEVAKVACLERKYFSAYFKSKVGITFSEWVRLIRVEQAKELMRTSERTIAQVAFEVGFGNVRTFERAFKGHGGLTARAFRDASRPNHD